jgi:hypothetical protein
MLIFDHFGNSDYRQIAKKMPAIKDFANAEGNEERRIFICNIKVVNCETRRCAGSAPPHSKA